MLTGRQVDPFAACFAFGVGAMIACYVGAQISGAHINPAVSLANALDGQLKWRLLPLYMCAQYLGGFLAALLLFVNYSEAINSMDAGAHSAFGSRNSTGQIFATYPGHWVSVWGALLDQIMGTAVLVFSLSAICDKQNNATDERQTPFLIALVIGFVCLAFSPNCGAIFNPARDLSPRLLTYLFGYAQPSVWAPVNGLYWLVAGVLGPHVGAIIGLFTYKLLVSSSLDAKREYEKKCGPLTLGQSPPASADDAPTASIDVKPPQRHEHASYQQQPDPPAKFINTTATKALGGGGGGVPMAPEPFYGATLN